MAWNVEGYDKTVTDFLYRLRSIAAHRDHFVWYLSVILSVCLCLSGSHTFLVVTHSYVSQATHGMLPLFLYVNMFDIEQKNKYLCFSVLNIFLVNSTYSIFKVHNK